MATNKNFGFLVIIVLIIVGLFFFSDLNLQSSILPEFDTRITDFDKATDMTQFVRNNPNDPYFQENNIATVRASRDYFPSDELNVGGACYNFPETLAFKKDFSRLNTFIRWYSRGGSYLYLTGYQFGSNKYEFENYEIKPDNLNVGVYDIFKNGEFIRKIDIGNNPLIISAKGGCNQRDAPEGVVIDYIKHIPIETFTIKNDEVWVTYRIRNTGTTAYSYSYQDIEDQQGLPILGFHSLIEPATIRDLIAQTEVPAPQIYFNLLNNKPVTIQPQTVHKIVFRAKFVEGMPLQCKGNPDQAVEKQPDGTWTCGLFVKETPIIQQCDISQNGADCPILKACESQKSLIKCEPRIVDNKETNLCIYDNFEPACKVQLITYQERVTEIENTKYVPIPSGTNSFFCFFDKTSTSCKVGEKTLSASAPSYICSLPSDSSASVSTGQNNNNCWQSTIFFDGNPFVFKNNEEKPNIGFNIKGQASLSGTIVEGKLRDTWAVVVKGTSPDNFLGIKSKTLGNKFILQNLEDKVTFTIINNLGFGIDGGYTIQTQNLALEGGVVIRDEIKELFLNNGNNDVTYNFKTEQLGTIVDIIGHFGKVTTDREYIMKSSENGKQKFLAITKEVVTELPQDIEKVQPKIEIVEKIIEKEVFIEIPVEREDGGIPTIVLVIGGIVILFIFLKLFKLI